MEQVALSGGQSGSECVEYSVLKMPIVAVTIVGIFVAYLDYMILAGKKE